MRVVVMDLEGIKQAIQVAQYNQISQQQEGESSKFTQYGVPSYQTRVVGIDLEGIKQAIQVAQYNQISQQQVGGFGATQTDLVRATAHHQHLPGPTVLHTKKMILVQKE
ncbi:unnamed protein product [Phaedon cochleariae]|uniref:Uncharacterized protein n=1 Tax=Phaedon cochleariae TaxID=80249 RepID=A0A9N9SJQ5_PHACE|nr:unnamed protein product [Phaedon cochleariae]